MLQNKRGRNGVKLRFVLVTTVLLAALGVPEARAVGGYRISGTGSVNVRSGPSTATGRVGSLGEGTAIDIACQVRSDSSVNGSTIWDRLNSPYGGNYVTDYYTTTPRYNDFSPGLPRCDQPPASSSSSGSSLQGKVNYANARNADIAAGFVNRSGEDACRNAGTPSPSGLAGSCKQFANCVVRLASSGQVNLAPGYYSKYAQYGVLVPREQTRRGDIIQLSGAPGDDSYHDGMHTAIVANYLGNNYFDVIYSNRNGDGLVHEEGWNPDGQAQQYGLQVYIWRLGKV